MAGLLILSYIVYQKKWIVNYFAGRDTQNLTLEASELSGDSLKNTVPVVLVGKIIFKDGSVPISRKDGKYFFQGLRLVCYFPDAHYQKEYYDYNFQVSNDGNFRIVLKVPLYKKKIPTAVKVTSCCCGYKDCDTKPVKLKGKPLTAYLPNISMERE